MVECSPARLPEWVAETVAPVIEVALKRDGLSNLHALPRHCADLKRLKRLHDRPT